IGVVTGMLDAQAREQRLAIFPADGKRIERILPSKKAPIPTQASPENNNAEAVNANNVDNTSTTSEPATETTLSSMPTETLVSTQHITSLIYDQMLRSGQSLNHVGGDLILTSSINSGAEAITDNSLHVYGRAQGRLVAGATGE
ncbi:septum site-determining protein MinC, partial [Pseudoalteromonas sp. SIMBA_153]